MLKRSVRCSCSVVEESFKIILESELPVVRDDGHGSPVRFEENAGDDAATRAQAGRIQYLIARLHLGQRWIHVVRDDAVVALIEAVIHEAYAEGVPRGRP